MNKNQSIKQKLIQTQLIFAPAFFGGFLGADLLSGSVKTTKILLAVAIYSFMVFLIYLALKSQLKNK